MHRLRRIFIFVAVYSYDDMKRSVLVLFIALFACNKPAEEVPVVGLGADGDRANMITFYFPSSANPDIRINCGAVRALDYWYVTVPEGTDLTKLVPEIMVSEGASVQIDGLAYNAGSAYDFSGPVQNILVTSQSGTRTVNYKICVKTGDIWIDNKIYDLMREFAIPGLALEVMRNTEAVYSSGFGFSVLETETRCTADHLFRLADLSRVLCTMSILTLMEEGRLKFDDCVFGENGFLKNEIHDVTPYHESITIRHLLSCSSGLCNGLEDPCFTNSFRFYSNNATVPTDTLIQRVLKVRQQPFDDGSIVYRPGAVYHDCNLDYCILQRVVEIVSGKDYESYLKEDVLEKMDITDTHIGGYHYERRANECVYYGQEDTDPYELNLRETAGALGVISSAKQLMQILTFMDGDDTIPDIFSYEMLNDMYTPAHYTDDESHRYGLGWKMNDFSRFLGGHYNNGHMSGSAALLVGGTDNHMNGVILCNTDAYNSNYEGDFSENLMNILRDILQHHVE